MRVLRLGVRLGSRVHLAAEAGQLRLQQELIAGLPRR